MQKFIWQGYGATTVDGKDVLIDSHNRAVVPAVWELFSEAVKVLGRKPTIIEWDDNIPSIDTLYSKAQRAETIMRNFMTLQNLQAEFAESLFADKPHCDGVSSQSNLLVYQNNLFSSMTRALSNTYPLIVKLVGDEFFPLLAKAYCRQYPSRSNNLDNYGAYFGSFLAEYEPTRSLIYLPEVAEFEWSCHEASFAIEHAPLSIESLQKITPYLYENLHFMLHSAIRIMKCNLPLLLIIDLC